MRCIHFDKSLFGTGDCTVSDDGKFLLPNWYNGGEKTVGYLERDGIYILDGKHRKKVFDLDSDGSLRLVENDWPFRRGTRIGSIDPDVILRDSDGREDGASEKGSRDTSSRILSAYSELCWSLFAVFVAIVARAGLRLLPAMLGLEVGSEDYSTFAQVPIVVTLMSSLAVSCAMRRKTFGVTLVSALVISWLLATAVFMWLIVGFIKPVGIELASAVLFGVFICLMWAGYTSWAASLLVFYVRRYKGKGDR